MKVQFFFELGSNNRDELKMKKKKRGVELSINDTQTVYISGS